jgi:hypothetical protein
MPCFEPRAVRPSPKKAHIARVSVQLGHAVGIGLGGPAQAQARRVEGRDPVTE